MKKLALPLLMLFAGLKTHAGVLQVGVTTLEGDILQGAVVYLTPQQKVDFPAPAEVAIMNQINNQFSPHILPIQKGSLVNFPNSDAIKHHVYSFSPARVFEIELYKGLKADPLLFEKTGVVELGCNVHDWMLGYILVVDTPYFAQTDDNGVVTMDLPKGDYKVQMWHPRLQPEDIQYSTVMSLDGPQTLAVKLTAELLPAPGDSIDDFDDEFGDY